MSWLSFINPLYLWALPLTVVPFLIHILSRRRKQVVEFSSVRLLVTAQQQNVERLNVREVVLLILRTLVVLFLICAAARPLVSGFWGSAIEDHEPTGVVLVLDGTLSMKYVSEGESVFERSLARAHRILEFLREDDRVRLIYSGKRVLVITGEEELTPHEVAQYLDGLVVTNNGGKLNDSLKRAVEMAHEMDLPWREVYVFTDLQPGTIDTGLFGKKEKRVPVIFFTERDSGAVNRYLGTIDLTRREEAGRGKWSLGVVVGSTGGGRKPGIFPRLYLDNEMAGIAEIRVAGEERKTAHFPLDTHPGPHRRVRVEIEEDGLQLDDVRYYLTGRERLLDIERGKGVNLLKPLRIALDLLDREVSKLIATTDFEGGSGTSIDTVMIALWSDVGGIREALDKGYGLVVFPDPIQIEELRKGPLPISSTGLEVSGEGGFQSIASPVDPELPGFIHELTTGLERVRVEKYYRLQLEGIWRESPGNVWRVMLNGGDCFLVGGEVEGKRVVLWSTPPAEESTDLFRSPLFLPILDGILRYAAGGDDTRSYLCGDPVSKRIPLAPAGEAITIRLPGGSQVIEKVGPESEFKFEETDAPGFYTLSTLMGEQEEFAVNIDTRESDFSEMTEDELNERLSPMSVAIVRNGMDLTDVILAKRGGREISTWLLLGVFIVLLAESHISGRIQRD